MLKKWVPDITNSLADANILETDKHSDFTPIAKPYDRGKAHDSLVHCTTRAWDRYVRPIYEKAQKLSRRECGRGPALTDRERQSLSSFQQQMGKQAYAVLGSLMLRRTMVSRIPFNNPRPIIDIPPMHMETVRIRYPSDSESALFHRKLINTAYGELRNKIAGETPQLEKGRPHVFGPRWRFIRLVSLSPLLATASMKSEMTSKMLWETKDDGFRPNVDLIKELLLWFREVWPSVGLDSIPLDENNIKSMRKAQIQAALLFGAPKLGWLRRYLNEVVIRKREKVILWVFWPLSQWLVEQV